MHPLRGALGNAMSDSEMAFPYLKNSLSRK